MGNGDPVSHGGFSFSDSAKRCVMKSETKTAGIEDGKEQKTEEPLCEIMWLDPDVKFVSINSLFKRPDDKSF